MSRPIPVPSRRPTGPGWDQIFFHGMGWDQISVGWELPVPSRLYARTGMGQGLGGMGAPIPVPRPAYSVFGAACSHACLSTQRHGLCQHTKETQRRGAGWTKFRRNDCMSTGHGAGGNVFVIDALTIGASLELWNFNFYLNATGALFSFRSQWAIFPEMKMKMTKINRATDHTGLYPFHILVYICVFCVVSRSL